MGPTLPATLSGQPPRAEAMREAARKFEAQALGALLQPAFATVSGGSFGGGAAEGQWRPMLVDAYAEAWSRQGGIGLAASVLQEMLRAQSANASANASASASSSAGAGGGTGTDAANLSSTLEGGESPA
ncbi:Chemotactic signal-response protein cheL [Roseomonas mucosa]|uniref:Chemotaxis protein chel n=1 Tax=Roseomonas mucosa TaxID=207340 RepID=A0A1S8DAY5_9PROT|nr:MULTISPECIES: rod-binding protein [Roseomonas]ATR20805.1 chemotaxis protein chel [Roseomonas sp. FDAARGOS_362]MDT8265002.1 rod-binding protein [Roseomonas sp. DSM 102946]ONH84668.1 chemotaxis protein chel [Roseomonas mucosa]UZO96921.1 Chemotactic signal-response protein cheL [Roseomonas mucosa]